MNDSIHDLESYENGNSEQGLLVVRDVRQLPAHENEQRDEQNESAQEVADDRLWMSPLACGGDAPDPTLGAQGHAYDDEQDDVQAHVGEQRNLFAGYADEGNGGEEQGKSDNGWSDHCRLCDGLHGSVPLFLFGDFH
jgi:hypothetical protein